MKYDLKLPLLDEVDATRKYIAGVDLDTVYFNTIFSYSVLDITIPSATRVVASGSIRIAEDTEEKIREQFRNLCNEISYHFGHAKIKIISECH